MSLKIAQLPVYYLSEASRSDSRSLSEKYFFLVVSPAKLTLKIRVKTWAPFDEFNYEQSTENRGWSHHYSLFTIHTTP